MKQEDERVNKKLAEIQDEAEEQDDENMQEEVPEEYDDGMMLVELNAPERREAAAKRQENERVRREKRRIERQQDEGLDAGEPEEREQKRGRVAQQEAEDVPIPEDEFDTDITMEIRRLQQVQPDIAEAYSPPRVAEEGKKWGLMAGESMDITTGWDFRKADQKTKAWNYVKEKKPKMLIGSPMCRMFSQLQNLSPWDDVKQANWKEAVEHIKFVISLYRLQVREGRLFLHEHPAGASSWGLKMVQDLMKEEGVVTSIADQCQYGLMTQAERTSGVTPARKRTRFMTNSIAVAEELSKKCQGGHVHTHLMGGNRASQAARYPQGLCEAICRGLVRELRWKEEGVQKLMSLSAKTVIDKREDHEEETGGAWDDVSGVELDMKKVMEARKVEIGYVHVKKVWTKIPRRVAVANGWKIIKTRWIDINKGDSKNPNYRSRFVGKEFNNGAEDNLFAATPPLEALRLLVSELATEHEDEKENDNVMMVNDVARAFFEAWTERDICIELPDEDREEGEGDMVGKLQKSLYGTRDAAANFQKQVTKVMRKLGFKAGKFNPCTFMHKDRKIKTIVHGDDFISKASREDAKWLKKKLEENFEIKTKVIGNGDKEQSEERILNRVIRVTAGGWEYEADQRHADIIIDALNLNGAKPVQTPSEDDKPWKSEEDEQVLNDKEAREYRSLAARANYLALDRADIQFACKEICRGMANPTRGHHRKLKRLARYLIGVPRVVIKYKWQKRKQVVQGFSDADWAGCKKTAKSTSGGAIVLGEHLIKSWSSTQKGVTLSSGESELVAAVKTSTEVIGILQLLEDWNDVKEGEILVDASAALGVVRRKGNGKLRHIRVGLLWVQEKEENGELKYSKVCGEVSPADMMTKGVPPKLLSRHMARLGLVSARGRAQAGLDMAGDIGRA